jgi:hypothetical protein
MIVLPIASAAISSVIGARDLGKEEAMLKKRLTAPFFFIPQMPNLLKIRLKCCTGLALYS